MTNDDTSGRNNVLDVRWGADAIGEAIGKSARQTFHLLQSGAIPARKVGKQWCADLNDLRAFFRREVA